MIRHEDAKYYLGMEVIYNPTGEHGVIQSVNDMYVFVLYLGDRFAKATSARDLSFLPIFHESYVHVTPGVYE